MTPVDHLNAVKHVYPNAWKMCDQFRADRGTDLPKWPSWCFMPIAGWYTIVSSDIGQYILPPHIVPDAARLAALGAWRVTQGIYSFDADIYSELIETVLTGEMPVDVFLRMPEWCMYVETPGIQWAGKDLYGFWVHLEWDANTERKELRFVFNQENALTPFMLHMGKHSVTEAVDLAVAEAEKQAAIKGVPFPGREETMNEVVKLASDIQPVLALVLYLCSEEPDIEDGKVPNHKPERPRPKKTKKGWRMFPAKSPLIWIVGEKIGAKIRKAKQDAPKGESSVTPHVRRAHWHGYWIGSGDDKRFIYKWLMPIIVGL